MTIKSLIKSGELEVPSRLFDGKSYIGIIIDKSGSMGAFVDDVIGGFNLWLDNLRRVDGSERAIVSCTLFNTEVEERNVLDALQKIAPLDRRSYVPEGGTALLDAAYTTIRKLESSVGSDDRALVLIITDGQENSSVEINRRQLRELIEELTNRGNWTFAYLGSDPSTFDEASTMGVPSHRTRAYTPDREGTVAAHAVASMSTNRWMSSDKLQDEEFFEGADEPLSR